MPEPGQRRSTPFVTVDMNYRALPTFAADGMQVRVCSDRQVVTYALGMSNRLGKDGETITWTQRMSVSEGSIDYDVLDGDSTTWRKFG